MTIVVPLRSRKFPGQVTLIDDADWPLISGYCWCVAERADARSRRFYAVAKVNDRVVYMHNFISGIRGVDHKNGDGLDNRRCNLRDATNSQNGANSGPRGGTSRFKGVYWNRNAKKWHAQVRVDGKGRHLGYFDSEVEAAQVYDAAAREAWGEYAHLNFP